MPTKAEGAGVSQDYPLEQMSPRAFEQLSAALATCVLGAGVEAFGSGPDGGREATFEGSVRWSKTDPSDDAAWNGYTVIQAKLKEHLAEPGKNATWLLKQIKSELESWSDPDSKRGRIPRYLIFVTNVRLSSVPGAGIDKVNEFVEKWVDSKLKQARRTLRERGLTDWKIWHRDQVTNLITVHGSVRNAFPSLLTAGDISSRLASAGITTPSLDAILLSHAKSSLGHERWVSLTEAGAGARHSVDQMVIDLDAADEEGESVSVLDTVFRRGEMVLKPSIIGTQRPHLVLTGQAGSGKSTITRFIAQVFRAGFLADEQLQDVAAQVRTGTAEGLSRLGIAGPLNSRWPIRVDLAKFADATGVGQEKGLLRWISERVNLHSDEDLKPFGLKSWFSRWPSIVILDGLDEVTSPGVRPRVLDEITALVEMTQEIDADMLVVVTTRPTGYTETLDPRYFHQHDLQHLDATTAIEYGRLVSTMRLADDMERAEDLIEKFERQAADRTMLRLMKTPLQVLIISILLETSGALPADRFRLFDSYFHTLYDREAAKSTSLRTLLSQKRQLIFALHREVGLSLQQQSENAGDARAVLSRDDLVRLIDQRLDALEFDTSPARNRIAADILQATTERLVLLVPDENDSVAFEVRSLQEVMAAQALTNASDDELRARLIALAPSAHWRNVWSFMAGSAFASGQDRLQELVVDTVERLDQEADAPSWLYSLAPEIAGQLLDDGIAIETPKWQKRLLALTLGALNNPTTQAMKAVAAGIAAVTSVDAKARLRAESAFRAAETGSPGSKFMAQRLRVLRALGEPGVRPGRSMPSEEDSVPITEYLRPLVERLPEARAPETLESVLQLLDDVSVLASTGPDIVLYDDDTLIGSEAPLATLLDDAEIAEQVELLLALLPTSEWYVARVIAMIDYGARSRRVVEFEARRLA